MPAFGFGVFQSPPEETTAPSKLRSRTATARSTPRPPTATSARSARESVGPESTATEVFVTTKLWISDYGYDEALRGIDGCLRTTRRRARRSLPAPPPGADRVRRHGRRVTAVEEMLAHGTRPRDRRCQLHGHHLENLIRQTTVVPAVNQVEVHPYFSQPELRDFQTAHDIVTQAWSPLGGVNVYRPGPERRQEPTRSPTIADGEPREDARTDHSPLAHRAWHSGRSRSRCSHTESRRTSTSSTSRSRRRGDRDRRARHRRSRRPQPRRASARRRTPTRCRTTDGRPASRDTRARSGGEARSRDARPLGVAARRAGRCNRATARRRFADLRSRFAGVGATRARGRTSRRSRKAESADRIFLATQGFPFTTAAGGTSKSATPKSSRPCSQSTSAPTCTGSARRAPIRTTTRRRSHATCASRTPTHVPASRIP